MTLEPTAPTPGRQRSPLIPALAAAALLAVLVFGYAAFRHFSPRAADPQGALSQEERAYLPNIVISGAAMSAASNYLGGRIVYLDAKLTNRGSRPVRRIELQLEFLDVLNQVVLRETAQPLTLRQAPLKPGETRDFQIAFEHLPADWNQAPPSIQPRRVNF